MRRFAVCLLLLWLIAVPATGVQIVEFCPDPWLSGEDDEFIVLQGEGSLAGVRLTDGEGGLRFPEGASIQGRVVLARRADAYRTVHGTLPDWECFDTLEAVPDVIRSGDFRMANRGDELRLLRGTVVLQTVTWPGDVECREGQVHYREDGIWDPRVLAIGQSRFAPETFRNASVTAFVSPDAACAAFSRAVADADERILVNVYEMTHPDMANALIRARERGVSVTVLLEGGPVGGIPGGEEEVAGTMTASGIPVLAMTGTDTVHARYRYDHAKYLVVDGDTVLVTTENFKQSGFPVDGGYGNRGWGAVITHPGVARYFESVFWADAGGGDITAFPGAAGTALSGTPPTPATGRHPPAEFTDVTVTPVLSPDTSDLIPALIGNATATIDIQQASITNTSDGRLNPYLAAAVNASRAGVRVRVLLDSAWFNTDGDEDNDEMVALINSIARREGVPLAGRCADLEAMQAAKIHTKGIIVDGRSVAISSINWNDNSPRFNREAGVILDSPGVAGYFTAVFEEDWDAGHRTVPAGDTTTDLLRYTALAAVIGGVALLGWHRHLR
ncbi:MAG: phospholipase D-like domain-containing protein [Methanomicrobiales archaeon]